MKRWSISRAGAAFAVAAGIALVATGCTEKLDGSAGCPITCVDQSIQINTVTLDAVALDSTVPGGLGKGTEPLMLLSSRGDTVDTRMVVRFDTLPSRSFPTRTDTGVPIAFVDSTVLTLRVDSGAAALDVPATISVYDVDDSTAVDDTSATALVPLFTPSRLITSKQFTPGTLVDSLKIVLPNDFILAKAQAHARLRLGLQLSASKSAQLSVLAQESGGGPVLSIRVSPDTLVPPLVFGPYSKTPFDNFAVEQGLGDFTIVVKGTAPPPPGILAVGGLPATRAYIQFNIPPNISDSSIVIAATLLLAQQANASPDDADSMAVLPALVFAGASITDPIKAAQILAPGSLVAMSPLMTVPSTAGVREVQIAPVFRFWAVQSALELPRAIVLASTHEDFSPQQTLFYSSSSDPALRPRLRISYTPRARVGVP